MRPLPVEAAIYREATTYVEIVAAELRRVLAAYNPAGEAETPLGLAWVNAYEDGRILPTTIDVCSARQFELAAEIEDLEDRVENVWNPGSWTEPETLDLRSWQEPYESGQDRLAFELAERGAGWAPLWILEEACLMINASVPKNADPRFVIFPSDGRVDGELIRSLSYVIPVKTQRVMYAEGFLLGGMYA